MVQMSDKVTCLEEGLFGVANVKLGDDSKSRGVLVRNVHAFRRTMLIGLFVIIFAVCAVWLYSRNAFRAKVALIATECRSSVEGILLKQDEIDELCRRLRQRQILDQFLATERNFEWELQKRLLKVVRNGSETQTRKDELEVAIAAELKWFQYGLGDALDEIMKPIDSAFKGIPKYIKALQQDIAAEILVFDKRGSCNDLSSAIDNGNTTLKTVFHSRVARLVGIAQNLSATGSVSTEQLDMELLKKWTAENRGVKVTKIPPALIVTLLRWYTSIEPDELTNVLLSDDAEPALRHTPPPVVDLSDIEDVEEDDGNEEEAQEDDDKDDDDKDDDKEDEDGKDDDDGDA